MANPGPASTVSNHPQQVSTNQALRLLAVAKGVNISQAGDYALPVINSTTYEPTNVIVTNASSALSTAAAGVYTATGGSTGGGSAVVTSGTLTCAATTGVEQLSVNVGTSFTAQTMYFNVATAQGSGVTADVYVYGYDFS